ncbi:MAG: IS1182 family transposase [Spirochaetaceae bacterium]|nr:IS1182 family transposase [Spirochaetales bacterium]
MARYKEYSYEQIQMLPVSFEKQILPGSFEYTLSHLIDDQIDMTVFEDHYNNDETGAPAYDPSILLKVILFAYSRGINSSRKIEKLCEENIICMALAADTRPHFTTIADFVSSRNEEITSLFTMILSVCYSQGLIGKNMFAIDGCKISSNCSKEWSGTKDELLAKSEKIRKSVNYLLEKHKKTDESCSDEQLREKEEKAIRKLNEKSEKILSWLNTHEDKLGSLNQPIKSNIIDNESAKMSTGHGVIQGYNGIAAVDDKHQLIVWAEAFGDANESGHLPEILEGVEKNCRESGIDKDVYKKVVVTADTGFHNKKNMTLLHEKKIDAYIPDNLFRKRQVAFSNAGRYKKKVANWKIEKGKHYFRPEDFHMNTITNTLICPAGHPMILKCSNFQSVGGRYVGKSYRGQRQFCETCSLRKKCIRHDHTPYRQVALMKEVSKGCNPSEEMKARIDTAYGRSVYSRRMGTVEPVFGHISGMKKLNRFTLRSKKKVTSQWLLYCMVHNIGKIQRYGG